MKRVIPMILALVMLLAVAAQASGPVKAPMARPTLTFSGTTANCAVKIRADKTTDTISVTMKLWKGNSCLQTWNANGTGRVTVSKTATVTKGSAYKLTVDYTINGVKQTQKSVTNTCS